MLLKPQRSMGSPGRVPTIVSWISASIKYHRLTKPYPQKSEAILPYYARNDATSYRRYTRTCHTRFQYGQGVKPR